MTSGFTRCLARGLALLMFLLPATVLAQEGAPAAPAGAAGEAAPAAGAAAEAGGLTETDYARSDEYLTPAGGTVWLPNQASVTAEGVDFLFDAVYWLSVICFLGITVAVVGFVWKFRARPGHKVQPSSHHNDVMETIWTVIPSLICVALFVGGWRGYVDMTTPPAHSLDIQVRAGKWFWEFTYPNGATDTVLHVPAGRSVRLNMKSDDVIHSFFVPTFRIKQDVLPRRYTQVWFKAEQPTLTPEQELQDAQINEKNRMLALTQPGHRLFCTEYCGTDHSQMKTRVVVHNPGGFDNYVAYKAAVQDNLTPVERGKKVFDTKCVACHTVDGTRKIGPSFKGIWGETHTFTDGSTAVVDENYVRESLLNPKAKIRQSYPDTMTSFQGQLSDEQILGVIEYIKSLKE